MSGTVREPEYPSADRLRVYGDFMFLTMRARHFAPMPVAAMRAAVEPAILLGHYKLFRFDGVPRGALTWAWLDEEAEARHLAGEALRFRDWRSGDRLWIIDFLAPYRGLTAGMVRWVMTRGNMPESEFRYRRTSDGQDTRRVVHIDLDRHASGSKAAVTQGAA